MTLIRSIRTGVIERARCAKHNWLDGERFRMDYARGRYRVRTADRVELFFPQNPYLSFRQIMRGYLADGVWAIESGMHVMDAGACQGEFALYASRKVGPSGRVYVLEPDPWNRRTMDEVFAMNGGRPEHVTVLECGLWKEPGTLRFAGGAGALSSLVDATADVGARAGEVIEVAVESLDSMLSKGKLGRLDFVKMDIEGSEVEALQGATESVRRLRPRFAIASYHRRGDGITAPLLERELGELGYDVHTGFAEHLTTYASPR